jgi:serine/threonine-protein kinase RsbW
VPDGTRDDAEMIVSELFTNAVRHTASRVVGCELRLDAGGGIVRLEVADQGQGMSEPRSREAGVDEEGGRGLLLVEVLSETWGVRGAPDGGSGRTVWAVLRVP